MNSERTVSMVRLGDCVDRVIDYRGKTPPKSVSGIPALSAAHVKQGCLDLAGVTFVSEKTYKEWTTRGFPQAGDVVITTEAPVGEVALLPADQTYLLTRRIFSMSGKQGVLDNRFLLYTLRSKEIQNQLSGKVRGSTVSRVLKTDIFDLEISLPNKDTQKSIAQILGTLDDKIALNKNINETLEGIAKALFKSWFIDFDPVRAKAEGHSTGLPDGISELFPNSFADSELGEIPSGWRNEEFGAFVKPKRGKIITKKTVKEGSIPVVAGGLNPAYFHNEFNVAGPVVTISGSGANAGFVNLFFKNIWASDCSYISELENKNIFTIYLFLKTFQKRIFDAQHGAAQPHINPNDLMRLDFIIARKKIIEVFESLVTPFFRRLYINTQEISLLENMRDTLLPKLISGELILPDAEKMIEEVGI